MKLNHIKEEICSTCGARIKSESQKSQHCSGEWNEERTFACGRVVSYSPNFKAIEVLTECPKDKKVIAKNKKRAKVYDAVMIAIDDGKCDEEYKTILSENLKYLNPDR